MNNNELQDLVFGFNTLDKIVSIEASDDRLVVFREENGQIEVLEDENLFWVLTNKRISSKQDKLDGDQHYKYIAKLRTAKERNDLVSKLKKAGVDYYRIYDVKEQSLIYQGMTYFKSLTPKDVSILSFDIETTGLLHNEDAKVLLISNTYRNGDKIERKLFAYDEFKSQKQMIDEWCKWVCQVDPTIMCGHNIFGFDFSYLQFIARSNNTYLRLGRDGSTIQFDKWESSFRKDGSQDIDFTNAHIYGREIIDTMFLSYKYDFKREFESYGLKPIIKHLGLEKQDRTFVDSGQIRFEYKNPETWSLIKKYAIEDADDSLKLYDVMGTAYFYVAQSVSKSFQQIINSATGSQINNIMVRSYLQKNHSIAKTSEIKSIQGGISFAVPAVYKNLFKIDIKSCYPSQILRFKLYDKTKDPAANFYKMVEYFTLQRFEYKKKYKETKDNYYKDLDASAKIFINSAYGACTTPGLNYNCEEVGAKITGESRKIIDMALTWASGQDSKYWFKIFHEKMGHNEK